ncbi:hypothetical protein D9M72_456940 [compost metagenome]
MRGAGVVDDDMHVAEGGQRGLAHGLGIVAARDVGAHRARLAAGLADRRGNALGGVFAQVGHQHAGALAREGVGDAFAEAGTAAGDDRYLVGQSHRLSPCVVIFGDQCG